MATVFENLKTYSFEVYPVPVIGNDYQDVTVLGSFNYQIAADLGFDAAAMHPAVYRYLPAGTVNDFTLYTYLKIKTQSGQVRFVAQEWIREDSIQVRDTTTAIVTISQVSPSDGIKIRNALVANGFNNVDIKFQ